MQSNDNFCFREENTRPQTEFVRTNCPHYLQEKKRNTWSPLHSVTGRPEELGHFFNLVVLSSRSVWGTRRPLTTKKWAYSRSYFYSSP